jgi:hypothetical protein
MRRHRLDWIVALVVAQLFASLAPMVRAQVPGEWIEICSAAGVKRVPAEPGQAAAHGGDHCSLCRAVDPLASPPSPPCVAPGDAPVWRIADAVAICAPCRALRRAAPARAPPQQ